ncbi:hypothetical protein [Streptomyces sp. NRRL S-481]|uniref:hypothetical protein n=1 Tax=Streptomyces sp. NRRL S-481 TaxID=1463911 RepID=UPI000692028F|nr:hypothetical protein [Streptomyces sp. NRRL S-481]
MADDTRRRTGPTEAAAALAAALGFPDTPSDSATPPRDLVSAPADRQEGAAPKAGQRKDRVVSRDTMPEEEPPPSVFRRSGAPALPLNTCAPPFVPEPGGHLSGLMVTAEPVESRTPGNRRAQWPT